MHQMSFLSWRAGHPLRAVVRWFPPVRKWCGDGAEVPGAIPSAGTAFPFVRYRERQEAATRHRRARPGIHARGSGPASCSGSASWKSSFVVAPNTLFGRSVTVTGLLSGKCVYSALEQSAGGDIVLLPPDVLNTSGVFLDDMTVNDLEERLQRPVLVFDGRWGDCSVDSQPLKGNNDPSVGIDVSQWKGLSMAATARIALILCIFVSPLFAQPSVGTQPTRYDIQLDLLAPLSHQQGIPQDLTSSRGEKKAVGLAVVYSLVLPGMGELYADGFSSGKYFLIAEGVVARICGGGDLRQFSAR